MLSRCLAVVAASAVVLAGAVVSEEKDRKGPFDFQSEWQWDDLRLELKSPSVTAKIDSLQASLSMEDARFLLGQLSRLKQPDDIYRLSAIEKNQSERGGGFYGIIPQYFADSNTIPVPEDFEGILECAVFLSGIRDHNSTIIAGSNFQYPLDFSGEAFSLPETYTRPPRWSVDIDLSLIHSLLDLYDRGTTTREEADSLAATGIVVNMLEHRRNLGYVPEPLPDTGDMAEFIFRSASTAPVDQVWKWLNPWNDFCLADLYLNRVQYARLLVNLETHRGDIGDYILGRMYEFAPADIAFSERIGFAVNWGIRSWATSYGLGTNIVQFKDRYSQMLRSITHETFHRLQLRICPVDSSRVSRSPTSFDDLVFYGFKSPDDRKFYETISYVMLEGTATYVGGVDSTWDETLKMQTGYSILDSLYTAAYVAHNLDTAESLLNRGLKSNGPFYGLGYAMSRQIVDRGGHAMLGKLLQQGSPFFFMYYERIVSEAPESEGARFDPAMLRKIDSLAAIMKSGSQRE